MNLFTAILAGLIQGTTEFLPISSTAHLIIFQNLFKISPDQFGLTFDASLHLGTLIAIIIFFYKDYLKLFDFKNPLLGKIILATIPAAIAGILVEGLIETSFRNLNVIAFSLILFSLIIIAAEMIGKQKKDESHLTKLDAIIIGIAQSIALIPGISRSGSTISAGLFLGLKRDDAARFAFMISGPIVAAAGMKKFVGFLSDPNLNSNNFTYFYLGIASSFIFGYLTIKYFLKFLRTNSLYPFVIYRLILGFIILLML